MISRASERVAKGHVVVVVAIMARRRGIILFSRITIISFCSVLGVLLLLRGGRGWSWVVSGDEVE